MPFGLKTKSAWMCSSSRSLSGEGNCNISVSDKSLAISVNNGWTSASASPLSARSQAR
jgi:hypothetical protein